MEPTSELRIPSSRVKLLKLWSLPAGIIAVFAAWQFYRQGQLSTWMLLIVAGLVALVIQGQVTAQRAHLHLTPRGLTTRFPFRERSYAWSEIDSKGFRPLIEVQVLREMVVFNSAQPSSQPPQADQPVQHGKDYDHHFANLFAMPTVELAELLNQWRQRYARAPNRPE